MVDNPAPGTIKLGHKRVKWYYVAGGIAAVGFVYVMYRRNSAAPPPADASADGTTADPTTDPGYYDSGYTAIPGDGYGGPAYGVPPNYSVPVPPESTTAPHEITNNNDWVSAGAYYLSTHGHSGSAARVALSMYVAKLPLTDDQAGQVEAVIHQYGNPPLGSYNIVHVQAKGTVPPPNVKYYFVVPAGPRLTVEGNKKFVVSYKTWSKFSPKPKTTPILRSNPIYKLPYGGVL